MKKTIVLISSVFSIFLVWIIMHIFINNALLFPSPLEVIKAFFMLFTKESYLISILWTIFRLIISLLAAFILGIISGVLSARFKLVKTYLSPFITVLRTIPVLSVIVIIVIVTGISAAPYLIAFLMIFPLCYQGVTDSISNIDPAYIDIYRLESSSVIRGFIYCYFPLIRNQFLTTILQSLGLGIKVIVMAEYLAQIPDSIGNELYLAKTYLEYDNVFAWTLFLIILSLGLEVITMSLNKRNLKGELK